MVPDITELDRYADLVAAMIADDVAAGAVPVNVPDWTTLQDYVDANDYTLSVLDWEPTQECIAFTNAVEDAAWARFTAARPTDLVDMAATAMTEALRDDTDRLMWMFLPGDRAARKGLAVFGPWTWIINADHDRFEAAVTAEILRRVAV
jgi:hypothetical protein